jgi:hypothetical protein
VLAAIALGAAAIAAWMIWQRSSVSPSGQIIEVIDGVRVRLNGAVREWSIAGGEPPNPAERFSAKTTPALRAKTHRRASLSHGAVSAKL